MGIAVLGLLVSIVMIVLGVATIGRRGELSVERTASEGNDVSASVEANEEGISAQVDFFSGLKRGFSLYGEKSTSDILTMMTQGRLNEAWPWAMAALGVLSIFFWAPLIIGLLAGWSGLGLWAFVALFFFGALWAAFPRRTK
ncbi:MAG: hypothetical protein RMN25_13085 [Anaerolineae bacterium]|nr:phosphoethanolamine transferase CptA [Thermoflexales bacterium]MDW8408707.1 hypothetical protein [Anaerolineae bacterium]